MTALTSVYSSLTSLLSFSKAIDVIGDNVANLNTTGFKASDLRFYELTNLGASLEDMPNRNPQAAGGYGAGVVSAGRRFLQGEIRQTGTASHLAIDGQGFFVLSTPTGMVYTRSGQFDLDGAGRFIDPATGGALQKLSGGQLSDMNLNLTRTNPPVATTRINFSGNLSSGATNPVPVPGEINVFDADGGQRKLSLEFTRDAQQTSTTINWKVSVKEEGVERLAGEIRFLGSGAPAPGFNSLQLLLTSPTGKATVVALEFGSPGSLDGATSFSGTDSIKAAVADGYASGRLTDYSFDNTGLVTLRFSNGQTETADTVALAAFPDPKVLTTTDGLYFRSEQFSPELGKARSGGFGSIAPRSLELANVELAREFADIIILQRGYQASSQVLNVSSKLIEDVYNSVSGRG